MSELVEKVAKSCGISESAARREISSEVETLMADEDFSYDNMCESANNLGVDVDDLMSNPEMLLGFL